MSAERPVDPRIVEAAGQYREVLEKLATIQDPLLRKIVSQEALEKLENAVVVSEAVEMQDKMNIHEPCKN
jgi:hypothetical protein